MGFKHSPVPATIDDSSRSETKEKKRKKQKRVLYLEQCSCKNWPVEFDLCGLRYSRVFPTKGHPRLPGGVSSAWLTCRGADFEKMEINANSPNKRAKPTIASCSTIDQDNIGLVIFILFFDLFARKCSGSPVSFYKLKILS